MVGAVRNVLAFPPSPHINRVVDDSMTRADAQASVEDWSE